MLFILGTIKTASAGKGEPEFREREVGSRSHFDFTVVTCTAAHSLGSSLLCRKWQIVGEPGLD